MWWSNSIVASWILSCSSTSHTDAINCFFVHLQHISPERHLVFTSSLAPAYAIVHAPYASTPVRNPTFHVGANS